MTTHEGQAEKYLMMEHLSYILIEYQSESEPGSSWGGQWLSDIFGSGDCVIAQGGTSAPYVGVQNSLDPQESGQSCFLLVVQTRPLFKKSGW